MIRPFSKIVFFPGPFSRTNSAKSSNHVVIERYTPTTKYSNALFYAAYGEDDDNEAGNAAGAMFPPRSNSTSSSCRMDYKVKILGLII